MADWFLIEEPRKAPLIRLFCLPYGGVMPPAYRGWSAHLPATVEVVEVQLPGRGARARDAAPASLVTLADDIAEAVLPLTGAAFAVFGHSFGAWLAFEVVRRLEAAGRMPLCLFVSGAPSPRAGWTRPGLSHVDDDRFLREVKARYSETADTVFSNDDIAALVLPALRSDLRLLEHYAYAARPPLAARVQAIAGAADPVVSDAELAGWERETNGTFGVARVPGGHNYFLRYSAPVISLIRQRLNQEMGRAPLGPPA